jgi:hypothetical protein
MIKSGWVLLVIGLLIALVFNTGVIPANLENLLRPMLLIGLAIGSAVVLIVATEKHLSKTFDQKQ